MDGKCRYPNVRFDPSYILLFPTTFRRDNCTNSCFLVTYIIPNGCSISCEGKTISPIEWTITLGDLFDHLYSGYYFNVTVFERNFSTRMVRALDNKRRDALKWQSLTESANFSLLLSKYKLPYYQSCI